MAVELVSAGAHRVLNTDAVVSVQNTGIRLVIVVRVQPLPSTVSSGLGLRRNATEG